MKMLVYNVMEIPQVSNGLTYIATDVCLLTYVYVLVDIAMLYDIP